MAFSVKTVPTTSVWANEGQCIDAVDRPKCNCLESLFGLTYANKETSAQINRNVLLKIYVSTNS